MLRELLADEPFRTHFFQAVRLLARSDPEHNSVGRFVQPATEVVRFAARASMEFPASEVHTLDWKAPGPPIMTVNFMGLTGPTGILPLVYTELVMERMRSKDHALREMLDIFNHRMISLFYRAWEKNRFPVGYERDGSDVVSAGLRHLVGLGTSGLQDRQDISDGTLIYYSGLLSQRPRSAAGLQQLLADYFEVPVEVQQFCGAWYKLERSSQTCLDERPSPASCLGGGAVVGDEMWDLHAGVRIRLGPLELSRYLEFLPGGEGHRALRSLVRFYANDEFAFDVQLVLKRDETPGCKLGESGAGGPRLGWVTWVNNTALRRDPEDTVIRL
jgi:type VI secretion system protein ImpH